MRRAPTNAIRAMTGRGFTTAPVSISASVGALKTFFGQSVADVLNGAASPTCSCERYWTARLRLEPRT